MKLRVFDTETTGFPNKIADNGVGHEVIQFSAIELGEGLKINRVINRYCKSTAFVSSGALAVHHLTDKKIDTLSGGKFLEQVIMEEQVRDVEDVIWIMYNASFDKSITNQTLVHNGAEPLNFGKRIDSLSFDLKGTYYFDMMPAIKGISGERYNIKLSQAIARFIGIDRFRSMCQIFRESYGIVDPLTGEGEDEDYFHNSIFDSLALCILLSLFKNNLFD